MVAPGDNLEFEDLPRFAQRVETVPTLREKVVARIKNRPNDGEKILPHLTRFEMQENGKTYVVYFGRRRNHIGLVQIFEWPTEADQIKAYEKDMRQEQANIDRGR